MLTTQQFQKDVFNTVVDSLARREMHRFLKLVSPENKNFRGKRTSFSPPYSLLLSDRKDVSLLTGNVGWCIAFKQEGTGSGISSGKITVNGRTFSLHQILFKFFRPNLSNVTLEDLILTSRKDCKVSRYRSCYEVLCNTLTLLAGFFFKFFSALVAGIVLRVRAGSALTLGTLKGQIKPFSGCLRIVIINVKQGYESPERRLSSFVPSVSSIEGYLRHSEEITKAFPRLKTV